MFDSKSKIFRYFLLCFIFGVAIRSFFTIEFFWFYLLGLITLVLAILFWPDKFFRYLFLGGIFISLGIWRYQLSLPQADESKIWFYNSQKVNFEGIIIKEPDIRINQTRLIVAANKLGNQKVTGKVLVRTNLYPEYQYGDLISVSCQLNAPQIFNDFNYPAYLAKDGIYSQCSYADIELIGSGYGDWLLTKIFKFKNKLQLIVNANLPEPQASLFSGIILGLRKGIPQSLLDKFSITSTSHIIAISGLNITIIIAILMKLALLFYFPRKKSFFIVTLILIGYIMMIGFPASAVRAAIMGWLVILALCVGRLNRSANALLFAASLMLLFNPKILRDDIGFQLSFLAVFGLIYFLPFLEQRSKNLPSCFGLKESFQMTLAAQLTTLPLIVYNFGRISLIGPLVNLLVLPVLPYLTIFSFVALFFSLLFNNFAQYLFWPAWLFLTYIIKVVELFSLIPGAAISL